MRGSGASPAAGRFRVERVDETGSTNADLLARAARDPDACDVVLVAAHQRAGRGRLDRRWEAPPGANLLVSLLLRPGRARPGRPPIEPAQWHRLTWAVGLAACEAARSFGVDARLKWPNDLVVPARHAPAGADDKLAGLLAESDGAGAVVVGVGLNVGWPAAGELPGATSLAALGLRTTVDEVLGRVLAAVDEHAPDLHERVRARSATIGRRVRVERPGGVVDVGDALDVLADGRVRVRLDDGSVRDYAVGDVTHLRPASSPPRA